VFGLNKAELRRKDRALTKAETEQILRTALVGRLGLSHDNQPYVVPLNFVYENGHIFFHSAETGMMIDYLRTNPSVCFEVDEYIATVPGPIPCKFSTAYRSVIVFGTGRVLTDLDEKTAALRLQVAKYAGRKHAEQLTTAEVDEYRSSLGSKTTVVDVSIERATGKAWQPQGASQ
jgi:nitroimidazol reductase NimA-like FMN-containing flavoprotein (pyridoxamine 5'-phosphate oxidase superfamily)